MVLPSLLTLAANSPLAGELSVSGVSWYPVRLAANDERLSASAGALAAASTAVNAAVSFLLWFITPPWVCVASRMRRRFRRRRTGGRRLVVPARMGTGRRRCEQRSCRDYFRISRKSTTPAAAPRASDCRLRAAHRRKRARAHRRGG